MFIYALMRYIPYLLLLLLPLSLQGQESLPQHPDYGYVSLDYGSKNYIDNFYGQLNTYQQQTLFHPVQLLGLSIGTPPDHLKLKKTSLMRTVQHLSFSQVIPQDVKIQDSIHGRLTGFVIGVSGGIDLLGSTKHFNLMITGGFNTGRLRMYENELLRQKNPFFSPKLAVEPAIRFGNCIISLKGEYEYDVSGANWRRTWFANKDKVNLNAFHQSGLTTLISVGYVIVREKE